MARSMFSLGMLAAFAFRIDGPEPGVHVGVTPALPCDDAELFDQLGESLAALASAMPFLCLIVCHLLWPDMFPLLLLKFAQCYHKRQSRIKARLLLTATARAAVRAMTAASVRTTSPSSRSRISRPSVVSRSDPSGGSASPRSTHPSQSPGKKSEKPRPKRDCSSASGCRRRASGPS